MSKWILPQRLQKEPILQHLGFSPVRLPSSVRAKVRIVEKVPKMCFGSYILTSLSLSPTMPLLTYSNSALLVSLAFVEHTACFCLRDVVLTASFSSWYNTLTIPTLLYFLPLSSLLSGLILSIIFILAMVFYTALCCLSFHTGSLY